MGSGQHAMLQVITASMAAPQPQAMPAAQERYPRPCPPPRAAPWNPSGTAAPTASCGCAKQVTLAVHARSLACAPATARSHVMPTATGGPTAPHIQQPILGHSPSPAPPPRRAAR